MSKSKEMKNETRFEDALKRLEEIVAELESGEGDLEDAVKLYEEGQKLRLFCEEKLEKARLRVEKITLDAKGKPTAKAAKDILPEGES